MATKESSLKPSRVRQTKDGDIIHREAPVSSKPPAVIQRQLFIDTGSFSAQTTFHSKTDATLYFPRIPRVWIPNGLIVVPSLQEPGVKGLYDLEIFTNSAITVTPLPDSVSRSVSGEWGEGVCGGSHINPSWKKNPRFILTIPATPQTTAGPTPFQIKLSRNVAAWKSLTRTDAVGCMLGFYIFVQSNGELVPFFETTFVPSSEVSTDGDFALTPLPDNEYYVIMPATYMENKHGAFVLTVAATCDFSLSKEKSGHSGHSAHSGHK